MKVRDVIRMVEDDGWYHVRTNGSHRHYRHAEKKGLVTVPGQLGKEMPPGTLNSVRKQTGLN